MELTLQPQAGSPPKPWERDSSASGPTPFRPPSAGPTSEVVEASGTANPGEIVSTSNRSTTANRSALGRPLPARPWEQNRNTTNYRGYGSSLNYNSGIGSGMYNLYGQFGGGLYNGGMYGNSMYRGGYGGLYGSGMYGGGIYNRGLGGPMGGPNGAQDPNDPNGPPSPPGFWMSVLRVVHGVVTCFGRISLLIDQNTQAFHMFMTALLQLFDRSGVLYGELARFVSRLLGIRSKPRKVQPGDGAKGATPLRGRNDINSNDRLIEGPKGAPAQSWDNVWGNNAH